MAASRSWQRWNGNGWGKRKSLKKVHKALFLRRCTCRRLLDPLCTFLYLTQWGLCTGCRWMGNTSDTSTKQKKVYRKAVAQRYVLCQGNRSFKPAAVAKQCTLCWDWTYLRSSFIPKGARVSSSVMHYASRFTRASLKLLTRLEISTLSIPV